MNEINLNVEINKNDARIEDLEFAIRATETVLQNIVTPALKDLHLDAIAYYRRELKACKELKEIYEEQAKTPTNV
jgi:hypothetical protein